jgi:hypothetical protein
VCSGRSCGLSVLPTRSRGEKWWAPGTRWMPQRAPWWRPGGHRAHSRHCDSRRGRPLPVRAGARGRSRRPGERGCVRRPIGAGVSGRGARPRCPRRDAAEADASVSAARPAGLRRVNGHRAARYISRADSPRRHVPTESSGHDKQSADTVLADMAPQFRQRLEVEGCTPCVCSKRLPHCSGRSS